MFHLFANFRWYLLKLKKRENKTSRRTLLVDEMRPLNCEEEEVCKLVEEVITVRQMMKALTVSLSYLLENVFRLLCGKIPCLDLKKD